MPGLVAAGAEAVSLMGTLPRAHTALQERLRAAVGDLSMRADHPGLPFAA